MTEFHWEAPSDFTGDFAAVLQITPVQAGRCEIDAAAEGAGTEGTQFLFWMLAIDHLGRGPAFVGTWYHGGPHPVQAHVGPVHTSDFNFQEGTWGLRFLAGLGGPPSIDVTIVGFGLADTEGAGPPLSIDVTCEEPFRLSLFGGRDAVGFTENTFRGGVGASVTGNVAAVNVADAYHAQFDEELVRLQAWKSGGPLPGGSAGELRLDHPNGTMTRTWPIDESGGPVLFDGGPGQYDLHLTLAGAAGYEDFQGVLIGVNPVDSLDEAV